jgi:hypothetical protein
MAGRRKGAASSSSDDLNDDAATTFEQEDKKLIPYSKQLPTLTLDNFVEFKSALENLAYFADWHKKTMDLKLEMADPWDGLEEADKLSRNSANLPMPFCA